MRYFRIVLEKNPGQTEMKISRLIPREFATTLSVPVWVTGRTVTANAPVISGVLEDMFTLANTTDVVFDVSNVGALHILLFMNQTGRDNFTNYESPYEVSNSDNVNLPRRVTVENPALSVSINAVYTEALLRGDRFARPFSLYEDSYGFQYPHEFEEYAPGVKKYKPFLMKAGSDFMNIPGYRLAPPLTQEGREGFNGLTHACDVGNWCFDLETGETNFYHDAGETLAQNVNKAFGGYEGLLMGFWKPTGGKWYFEIDASQALTLPPISQTSTTPNPYFMISKSPSRYPTSSFNQATHLLVLDLVRRAVIPMSTSTRYEVNRTNTPADEQIFGILMDMDAGNIKVKLNDVDTPFNWNLSAPWGEVLLCGGNASNYRSRHQYFLNWGQKPFKHAIPAGFNAGWGFSHHFVKRSTKTKPWSEDTLAPQDVSIVHPSTMDVELGAREFDVEINPTREGHLFTASVGNITTSVSEEQGTLRSGVQLTAAFPLPHPVTAGYELVRRENTALEDGRWDTIVGDGYVKSTIQRTISGTVVPTGEKVWLFSRSEGRVVRSTVSNRATGEFEFKNVRMDTLYDVFAYDSEGTFKTVAAGPLSPKKMGA